MGLFESDSSSSDECAPLVENFDGELQCEAVLNSMNATCLHISAMQFAMIPLVFLMAKAGLASGAFLAIAIVTATSLAWQLSARNSFARWMRASGWETHLDMVPLHLGFYDSLALLGSIIEALDPSLDAWTAANAEHMMSTEERQKFATAWGRIWLLGPWFARLGLPRILLLVLVMSTMVQVVACLWKWRQTLGLCVPMLRQSLIEKRCPKI